MSNNYDKKCPIWGSAANFDDQSAMGELSTVDSPRAGGLYKVDESGLYRLRDTQIIESTKVALSRWIFEQRISGVEYAIVTEKVITDSRSSRLRSVTQRIDDSLLWFAQEQKTIAATLPLVHEWHGISGTDQRAFLFLSFLAASSSATTDEGQKLLDFLVERGSVKSNSSSVSSLTPLGWSEVDRLRTTTVSSTQAFVAMWFDPQMDDAYSNGIEPGITDAGYSPFKINNKDYNGKVDDEIIAEIRRSKFVVAEFTCGQIEPKTAVGGKNKISVPRGGVYFEAGFAKGLGREVIWLVREDQVSDLHFDTRQFNHVVWKDPADLRKQLSQRISATLGDGPLKK